MGLLGFIDTTFILTLGIILLISGCIMIYCYKRINTIENGLIQQGRILQEFIVNYNESIKTSQNNNSLFANNTMDINNIFEDNVINNNDKIIVSDDEDSDDPDDDKESDDDDDENDENSDDNDDDSDDNDDDSDDNDEDSNNNNNELEDNSNLDMEISKKLFQDFNKEIVNINNVKDDDIEVKNLSIEDLTNHDISNLDNLNLETLDINNLDVSHLENTNNSTNSKIIPISDNDGLDISKKNPSKLKVDDLRELVVSKNLIGNEEASKLKKSELLKLLE